MVFLKRAQRMATLTAIALGACVLAACEDSGGPSKDRPTGAEALPEVTGAVVLDPDPGQTEAADVAWTTKLDVLGQPVEAGTALLVLARSGVGVRLVSLDRKSGRENFSVPFHPGGTPPGVALTPKSTRTDAGRHLALVRRSASSPLEAIDARTGAGVRTTPFAIDDYDACSDGRDVCWSGYDGGSDKFGPLPDGGPTRWDLETGRLLENDGQDGAIQVGPDLYARGDGRTSVLTRQKGSQRSTWIQSTSLVVRPGADPSYGWKFELDERTDVYVGALGRAPAARLLRQFRAGKRVEIDYHERYLTVGIDARSGEQLWRRQGANPWCSLLRDLPEVSARTICVVEGASVQQEGHEPRDEDLVVTLEGVDPRSGETLWSHRLDGADAKRTYAGGKTPLAPYGIVLPAADGPVAVDMRSGELQLVDDRAVLLCSAGPDRITVYGSERTAGDLYGPCTPDGRVARGPVSRFAASSVDGEGRMRFVSMAGEVVAFRT